MKEGPMLFNAPMVRATLDDSKTMTRRMVKLPHQNPLGKWEPTSIGGPNGGRLADGSTVPEQGAIWHTRTGDCLSCPYGQPGDRLWVKEEHYLFGIWRVDGKRANGKPKYRFEVDETMCAQFDEWPNGLITGGRSTEIAGWYKRIGMFMPRWASRILLEITGVRVERLQDINEADAIAEGIEPVYGAWRDYQNQPSVNHHPAWSTAIDSYRSLWESINSPGSWDLNPFVWVIEFKRISEAQKKETV